MIATMSRKLLTSQKVVESAAGLFLSKGFNAVSMDQIAAKAGVTKVTVYQHFRSKELLLAACLRWRLERRESSLDRLLAGETSPFKKFAALFAWMEKNAATGGFCGCAFLKAAAEVSAFHAQVREIALEAKRRMRRRCTKLAGEALSVDPIRTGQVISLLIEGAQSWSLLERSATPFRIARNRVEEMLTRRTYSPADPPVSPRRGLSSRKRVRSRKRSYASSPSVRTKR